MNTIELEAQIIRIREFQNNLGICLQETMFPGRTTYYTTSLQDKEKWESKLTNEMTVKMRGNVAEIKQYPYGSYISIYNPTILETCKYVPEHVSYWNNETDTANQGEEHEK